MWIKLIKQTSTEKTVWLMNLQHIRKIQFISSPKVSLAFEFDNGDIEIIEGRKAQRLWTQIQSQIAPENVIESDTLTEEIE